MKFEYTQEQYIAAGKFALFFGLLEDMIRNAIPRLAGPDHVAGRDVPFNATWRRAREILEAALASDGNLRAELAQLDHELQRLGKFRNEMFNNLWLPQPTDGVPKREQEDQRLFRVFVRARDGEEPTARGQLTVAEVLAAAGDSMTAMRRFWELATPIVVTRDTERRGG